MKRITRGKWISVAMALIMVFCMSGTEIFAASGGAKRASDDRSEAEEYAGGDAEEDGKDQKVKKDRTKEGNEEDAASKDKKGDAAEKNKDREDEKADSAKADKKADTVSGNEDTDTSSEDEDGADEDDIEPGDMVDWTVLVYLCGSDMESGSGMATLNLEEMTNTTPNKRVNVVFQTGGAKEWHADGIGLDIDPKKLQRYTFGEEGIELVDSEPLSSMSSSQTLSDFISWGCEEYPAEKYMLVLWDHGGGSGVGLIMDEIYGGPILSLGGLEKALDDAGQDFELIHTDCCLMASLEMGMAVKDHANYLVGAEETMSGYGTNWEGWLQYIYDKPECDGNELGAEICDSMQQKYAEMDDEMESSVLTLSTIDLSEIENVEYAFDEFFSKIGETLGKPDKYVPYAMASMHAEKYGGGMNGMVDLADLADKTRGLGVADEEAIELHDAVNAAVTHCVKGRGRSYSHGLSFFNGVDIDAGYLDRYARFAQSMPYLAYLDAVHADWEAPDEVYNEVEKIPELPYEYYVVDTDLSLDKLGNLQLQISNGLKGVTAVDYKLFRKSRNSDSYEELGSGTEVGAEKANKGIFTASFDGKWPAVNGNLLHMDLVSETASYDLFNSPMYVESAEDTEDYGIKQVMNMSTAFFKNEDDAFWTDEGEDVHDDEDEDDDDDDDDDDDRYFEAYGFMKPAYYIENNSLPNRGTYSFGDLEGATAQILYPIEDELTGAMIYARGDKIKINSEIKVKYTDLPAGIYGYAFVVRDAFGNEKMTEVVPFNWDGEAAEFILPEEDAADEGSTEAAAGEAVQEDNESSTEENAAVTEEETEAEPSDKEKTDSGKDKVDKQEKGDKDNTAAKDEGEASAEEDESAGSVPEDEKASEKEGKSEADAGKEEAGSGKSDSSRTVESLFGQVANLTHDEILRILKDYSITGEDADILRKAYGFVEEYFPDIKDKKKMDELIKYVYRLLSLFGETAGISF